MRRLFFLSILLVKHFRFFTKKWTLRECVDYAVKNKSQVINNQYNNDIKAKNLAMAKTIIYLLFHVNNSASFGQPGF